MSDQVTEQQPLSKEQQPLSEEQQPLSAEAQLKQLVSDRLRQGLGVAARTAGQQAGVLAQAVRQTGEVMRQTGEPGRGKVADQVAQPLQRLSGNLSHLDPQLLTMDVHRAKSKIAEQAQHAKQQITAQLNVQVRARTLKAGQALTAATQAAHISSRELRAQGQDVPALILDAVVERIEPFEGYLSTADADQLSTDAAHIGRQAKANLSQIAHTSRLGRVQAAGRGASIVKQAFAEVRRSPTLPVLGAVIGIALAARHASSNSVPEEVVTADVPEPQPEETPNPDGDSPAEREDLHDLNKTQLRERASAAGLKTSSKMSKKQLRDLITL